MMESRYTSDPEAIRAVGNAYLPDLVETLRAARQPLRDTEDLWLKAFREDRTPLGSLYADTESKWDNACDLFFFVLTDSMTRIDRAAEALVAISGNLVSADENSAGTLDGIFVITDED